MINYNNNYKVNYNNNYLEIMMINLKRQDQVYNKYLEQIIFLYQELKTRKKMIQINLKIKIIQNS